MPLVNVMVNQRAYTIACDDGEEDHLRDLAKHVDAKVRELLATVGQVGDARILLMAALLITDEYVDLVGQLESRGRQLDELTAAHTAAKERLAVSEIGSVEVLKGAAKRVGDIAARLAQA